MKKATKTRIRPSSKKQTLSQREEIMRLVRRNEFWIGVATIFVLILISVNLFDKKEATAAKGANVAGVSQKAPQATPSLMSALPRGIKKLADTSGFIKLITHNKPNPPSKDAPKSELKTDRSAGETTSSNPQHSQSRNEERNSNQNQNNPPANNSQTTATQSVVASPTIEPTSQPLEPSPTPGVLSILEEIVLTIPPLTIEPTETPEKDETEEENQNEEEQDNDDDEGENNDDENNGNNPEE